MKKFIENRRIRPQYTIADKRNLIGNVSPTKSKTLKPDLLLDATGTMHHDGADVEDDRGVGEDIAVAFLIDKIPENIDSVEILFAIEQRSVTPGHCRTGFEIMLKHATNLIMDMDRYKDSIGLLVTKSSDQNVPAEVLIEDTAVFLTNFKNCIEDTDPYKRCHAYTLSCFRYFAVLE